MTKILINNPVLVVLTPPQCDFRFEHNPVTDMPAGARCEGDATHRIEWEDGRFSFGCGDHLEIDPQASVKPKRTVKL